MNRFAARFLSATLATVVAAGSLFVSEHALLKREGLLPSAAEARVGRPLTPVSYAGVARRTTRRAVAAGAVVAAPVVVAPAPVVVAPARTCVQAVDAYGRMYTRCY
jgi:hypothetical protein